MDEIVSLTKRLNLFSNKWKPRKKKGKMESRGNLNEKRGLILYSIKEGKNEEFS